MEESAKKIEVRDQRTYYWHWVDNSVLACRHISAGDKATYSALATFRGCKVIRPSLETVAERSGQSRRTVHRSIDRLEKFGLIGIGRGVGRASTNTYTILPSEHGCIVCSEKRCQNGTLIKGANLSAKGAKSGAEKVPKCPTNNIIESDKNSLSGEAVALAETLKSEIVRNNPQMKPVSDTQFDSWAKEAELLIRIDKRDPTEARKVLLWCQQDIFWRTNILSMAAFRKHFDRLVLKRQNAANGSARRVPATDSDEPKLQTVEDIFAGYGARPTAPAVVRVHPDRARQENNLLNREESTSDAEYKKNGGKSVHQ